MRFSYYPGCSAHSTAKQYDASTRAVCRTLDIELEELSDWNCCGSSAAAHTAPRLATALSLRNLILADGREQDLALTCAFCFNRLQTTYKQIDRHPDIRQQVEAIAGQPYTGRTRVRHLLDILWNDIGLAALQQHATSPLGGLKVAAYYGCLLVRPGGGIGLDDPENPTIMDRILEAVGASCVSWPGKTDCCGASLNVTRPAIATRLVRALYQRASEAGAQCMVTACPLCFTNLETRKEGTAVPVYYFTELLGMAFGIPEARQWTGARPFPRTSSMDQQARDTSGT